MAVEIQNSGHFQEVIEGSGLVLADFYADWCEPCKWLDKILEKVELSVADKALLIKIDTEKHEEMASKFNVRSVPVLILFKEGKEVWRMNGFLMDPELIQIIEKFSRET